MKVNKETADAPRAKEKYIPLKSNAHGEFRGGNCKVCGYANKNDSNLNK